jgi:hypothetical protein
MAKLKFKFNVEVLTKDIGEITSQPTKEENEKYTRLLEELIEDGDDVKVKVKNFKWEVVE